MNGPCHQFHILKTLPVHLLVTSIFTNRIPCQAAFQSSNLPVVVIETPGRRAIPDAPKITAHMEIVFHGDGSRNSVEGPFNVYDGSIGVEMRGNSTQYLFPKKPFLIETRDAEGHNLNVSLLGMPKDNDWILLSMYIDKTLVRNCIAHHLSQRAGRYACRWRFCELVVNGSYEGVYLFMESIKPGKHRVPVTPMVPWDISGDAVTGGYIYEVSQGDQNFGERRCYKFPAAEDIRPEQTAYIRAYDDGFRRAMRQPQINDPDQGYPAWIDTDSFIDEILVQEACKNSDAYGWSSFFHKNRLGKLCAGPIWDFDQALCNSTFSEGDVVEEWQIEKGYWEVPAFWKRLFHEADFRSRLAQRWFVLRSGPFHTDSIMQTIDGWIAELQEAQSRNFERWPILGKELWRSLPGWEDRTTYESEVEYMKEWLRMHLDWMDQELRPYAGVEAETTQHAADPPVLSAWPNPFRSGAAIHFRTSVSGPLTLRIYNPLGQVCRSMTLDASGTGGFSWDGRNDSGEFVANGLYLVQLIGGNQKPRVRKLLKQ
jgi:hypothetical protein